MILSAQSIRKRCLTREIWCVDATGRPLIRSTEGLVSPFREREKAFGMSWGLSVAGYDVRVAQKLALEPGGFTLASTVECFDMPDDLIGFVKDKSTWARQGLMAQNTVIEPGWRGYLTLELTNHGRQYIDLEAGMPVAQIIFQLLDHPAEKPYSGKYQHQRNAPVAAISEDVA